MKRARRLPSPAKSPPAGAGGELLWTPASPLPQGATLSGASQQARRKRLLLARFTARSAWLLRVGAVLFCVTTVLHWGLRWGAATRLAPGGSLQVGRAVPSATTQESGLLPLLSTKQTRPQRPASMSRKALDPAACDVVIAGGSLSAYAAAVTAARTSPLTRVCLLEPTDWPGGQLTAELVPIDFGPRVGRSSSQGLPREFARLVADATNVACGPRGVLCGASKPPTGPLPPHGGGEEAATLDGIASAWQAVTKAPARPFWADWDINPGNCFVSSKCLRPDAFTTMLKRELARHPNLQVWYNAVVVQARRGAGGALAALSAVQRSPTQAHPSGYDRPFSEAVRDWYDPTDSAHFTKRRVTFRNASVYIEASEFGDVLGASGAPYVQGFEAPTEAGPDTLRTCGQSVTFPFATGLVPSDWPGIEGFLLANGSLAVPTPEEPFPQAGALASRDAWMRNWAYRRVFSPDPRIPRAHWQETSSWAAEIGDVTLQNFLNDGYNAFHLEDCEPGRDKTVPAAAAAARRWAGCLSTDGLAQAEQRSVDWLRHVIDNTPPTVYESGARVVLLPDVAGTASGLSKMPYVRDGRRAAAGLGGFRLTSDHIRGKVADEKRRPAGCDSGTLFSDVIGLADYGMMDIHVLFNWVCNRPDYLFADPANVASWPAKAFYIPFRALTVEALPNVLVAGKSLAQTGLAGSITRLHPSEWVTGTAAGAAAGLMVSRNWSSTSTVYANVGLLQALLAGPAVRQPLEFPFCGGT